MSDGTTLIYRYDGSFNGLMCCIFESFYGKELPERIISADEEQISLFSVKDIYTDEEKAERVEKAIINKISWDVMDNVRRCYFSCAEDKEIIVLRYVILGFRYGKSIVNMLADDTVNAVFKISRNFSREAQFYREFLRFTENDGVLVSVIEPKCFVLPYVAKHYSERLGNLSFLIYDKTHGAALVYRNHNAEIIFVDDLKLPKADEKELEYRKLWKMFYNTIGIEARYNDKLRMNMMPKRYWKHLTEFEDMYPELETFEERTTLPQK